MSFGDFNLSLLFKAISLTLTEITFRRHFAYCYFFTATIWDDCDRRGISFAQLIWLIASIDHVRKIDDFIIKLIKQDSYLLSGFSRHGSLSITAKASRDYINAMRTQS